MKFTATKSDLLTAIGRCLSVTDSKGTMPILACVLLQTGNNLRVAATDLYRSITTDVEVSIDANGSICLPARDLFERIKLLPDGKVAFSAEGTKVTLKAVGSNRRYTMHAVPGEEFPSLPQATASDASLESTTHILANLIAATHHSISLDQTRLHLSSLLLQTDGDAIRAVSTDGHRLSVMTNGKEPAASAMQWLIPLAAVNDLRKLFDGKEERAVTLVQSGSSLFAQLPEFTFSVKLVDAQFPPYQQVIPNETSRTVTVNRAALTEALRAVSVAASDKMPAATLTFCKQAIRVESQSPDGGEGFDEVASNYDGESVSIGFNAKYLIDALAVLGDEDVTLSSSGELDPVVVRAANRSDYLGVVMPCRT